MNSKSEERKLKSYMKRFFSTGSVFPGPIVFDSEIANRLKGNVFIVTGSSSPIGRAVANILLEKGATTIAVVRTVRYRGESQCDLSDPQQVLNFCERFKRKYKNLNGIINLGSGLYEKYETTNHLIEKTFATNVLAPYLLFRNLLPLIRSSGGARIVNVVNPLMLTVKMDPKSFSPRDMYYARDRFLQCERYRLELWHHLAREYPDIRFNCMTPGYVKTYGLEEKFPFFFAKYAKNVLGHKRLRNYKVAAKLVTWCLLSPNIYSIPNGALIFDRAVQEEYVLKKHETLAEEHELFIANFYKTLRRSIKEEQLNN